LLAGELRGWLDHRASAATKERKTGTIDELAARRQRMNPRLTLDWLRYLVTIGAREDAPGEYRWKLDPIMRFGGFGPWRPEWSMMRMPGLAMPVLGVLGLIGEAMGWGTQPEDVARFLPPGGTLVPLEDSGHFVHVEHPRKVADLVLDFIDDPPAGASWGPVGAGPSAPSMVPARNASPTVRLRHARAELALHELRDGEGRALLLLHGLAERSPDTLPSYLVDWPGPVFALDFVGHGESTVPFGGGYTAEMLLADADTALRHLGEATVLGRGLGAYVALLLAGARPDAVCGAILFDGPGILGGGTGPGPSVVAAVDASAPAPPDPFALAELSRDLRPPDYATNFVRLATQASALEHPITVASVNRPDWVEAVVREPGVLSLPLADALATYARA
jgi:pimeloyl-ACP methyl ester carboxylesterase